MTRPPETPKPAPPRHHLAFARAVRIAAGSLGDVAAAARRALDDDPNTTVLVFDGDTADVVDLDLRGSEQDVAARYAVTPPSAGEASPSKRGRPKLGVVPREVTLLPRHWDWLARQPGGASITLRRMVEAAQRSTVAAAKARTETAYRFMSAMAGDLPGFEEASRTLFAGDMERLRTLASKWPHDVAEQVMTFAEGETR